MKKSKLITSWFLTYIIVFSIPLISNVLIYTSASRVVRSEVTQYNESILNEIRLYTDSLFASCEKSLTSLSTNQHMTNLTAFPGETDESVYIPEIYKLTRDISSNAIMLNDGFDEIFIYFNNLDIAVASGYFNGAPEFFDKFYKGSNLKYAGWYSSMDENTYATSRICEYNDGRKYIELIYQLPVFQTSYIDAQVIFRFNEHKLIEKIDRFKMLSDKNFYIISPKNENILAYSTDSKIAVGDYAVYRDESGVLRDFKNTAVYCTSQFNNWKYIISVPNSVFWAKLSFIRTLFVTNIIISLILSVLVAYFFALKNYQPINNLKSKFTDIFSDDSKTSEFSLIENALSDYTKNKSQLRHLEHEHKKINYARDIENLLRGNYKKTDISFKYTDFRILIISISEFEKFFPDETAMSEDERFDMMFFIIQNVLEEIMLDIGICSIAEIDGQITGILNIDPNFDDTEKFSKLFTDARRFIEQNFGLVISVYVSARFSGKENIAKIYNKTVDTIKFKNIKKPIAFYETNGTTAAYSNISNEEEQLTKAILSGDFETFEQLLSVLTERCASFPAEKTKVILYDIVISVIKSAGKNGIDISDGYSVLDFNSLTEFSRKFLDFAYNICQAVKPEENTEEIPESKDEVLSGQVISFVDNNYLNSAMNIAMVGEHFSMTPYYISSIFKKVTGHGLLDYISKKRIDKAKELLCSTSLSLEEISGRTGFNSVRTFMRTFVKYESVTPGKYKEFIMKDF